MTEYLENILDMEQLERLAFEMHDDYWADVDFKVQVYELLDETGYQQFVFDEYEREKISFGIPLKTVADLMDRYKSITGYDARYWEGDLPIN